MCDWGLTGGWFLRGLVRLFFGVILGYSGSYIAHNVNYVWYMGSNEPTLPRKDNKMQYKSEVESGYNAYKDIIDRTLDRRAVAKAFLHIAEMQINDAYKRSPKSFPLAALVLAAEDALALSTERARVDGTATLSYSRYVSDPRMVSGSARVSGQAPGN